MKCRSASKRTSNATSATRPRTIAPISAPLKRSKRYLSWQFARCLEYRAEFAKPSRERCQRIIRKERRLEEIGFESQKRAKAAEQRKQAAENRKVEKHEVALAIAQLRKQRLEMKIGTEMADLLPPNFDFNS